MKMTVLNLKTAIVSALLSLFVNIVAMAQISPGALTKVHAHLEGMSNCTQCHVLGEKVSNEKCLACHTELNARITVKKGFHASPEVSGKECITCHSEHNGLNFQIVRFETPTFNHQLTGYPLVGAHSKKNCTDCHKPAHISDEKIKAKSFTYLGLKTECLACHADYHQQTLPTDCENCHNAESFKPATKFDHQKTKYPLLGKHQVVACTGCHKTSTRNGQKFQQFAGVVATHCTNCHKDVHNNKFGQKCTDCHTNESFKVAGSSSGFDHNKTDFKLEGKHQQVTCKSCHKQKLTTPLPHSQCTDCHTDYHRQQFVKNGKSPDCSGCHTVKGFNEFSYTLEQHNQGIFPLKGAHIATPCFECHKKTEKWEFKAIGTNCIDCHDNIHKDFIDAKYYPEKNCEACHSTTHWRTVRFDHTKTRFGLQGAHSRQDCRECHFNKEKQGHANQKFAGLSMGCTNCHKDIHWKQFERDGVTECTRCHNQESFKPATKFDHNTTQFILDGKHLQVACYKCHKETTQEGATFVLYKIKEFKCENCHLSSGQ